MKKSLIVRGSQNLQSSEKHCVKGCFHKNSEHSVSGPFVDPLFKHQYPVAGQATPSHDRMKNMEENYTLQHLFSGMST